MPSNRTWIGGNGGSSNVAQITNAVFASYNVGSTRTITMGTITVNNGVDSGGTLAATLTAFATYLNTLVHPTFAAITWSADATHIIGTADTLGDPFTFTAATTGTGATTNTVTTTTANAGPNDFGTAANWSGNAVPVNGDTIIFDGTSAYACCYGLNTGMYPAVLRIDQPETALIGLGPNFTTDIAGVTQSTPIVPEYRTAYLTFSGAAQAVACTIGREFGDNSSTGTGRCKIDFGDTTAVCEVWNSASTATDDGVLPIQILGNSVYTSLVVRKGLVSVGPRSETVVLASALCPDVSSFSRIVFGPNVTCPIVTVNGGSHSVVSCASQTITVNGGTLDVEGSTTLTTLACNAGSTYIKGAMTVTNPTVQAGALLNARAGGRSITLTSLILYRGCIYQSGSNVTHTNAISIPNGIYQLAPT